MNRRAGASRVPAAHVVAIVPAAGRSRRMGEPKLLLDFGGRPVLAHTLAALAGGGADLVVVVTAPDDRPLQRWVEDAGHRWVANPDPGRGMLSSIQEGLRAAAAPAPPDVLLVCPGDLPELRAATVALLLDERRRHGASLAVPTRGRRRGHPLAIAGPTIGRVPHLHPDIGLRQLLLEEPDSVLCVAVDDRGIASDLDTPEDYEAALRRLGAGGGAKG